MSPSSKDAKEHTRVSGVTVGISTTRHRGPASPLPGLLLVSLLGVALDPSAPQAAIPKPHIAGNVVGLPRMVTSEESLRLPPSPSQPDG